MNNNDNFIIEQDENFSFIAGYSICGILGSNIWSDLDW